MLAELNAASEAEQQAVGGGGGGGAAVAGATVGGATGGGGSTTRHPHTDTGGTGNGNSAHRRKATKKSQGATERFSAPASSTAAYDTVIQLADVLPARLMPSMIE